MAGAGEAEIRQAGVREPIPRRACTGRATLQGLDLRGLILCGDSFRMLFEDKGSFWGCDLDRDPHTAEAT